MMYGKGKGGFRKRGMNGKGKGYKNYGIWTKEEQKKKLSGIWKYLRPSQPTAPAPTTNIVSPPTPAPTPAPTAAVTAPPTRAPQAATLGPQAATPAPTQAAPTQAPTQAAPTEAPTRADNTLAPTSAASAAPTGVVLSTLTVEDFLITYVSSAVGGEEPTDSEIEELRQLTQMFFDGYLSDVFATVEDVNFGNVGVLVDFVEVMTMGPDPDEFTVAYDFVVQFGGNVDEFPTVEELVNILDSANLQPYFDLIRTRMANSPFGLLTDIRKPIRIQLEETFMSYVVTALEEMPSADSIAELVQNTEDFFGAHLDEVFSAPGSVNEFAGITVSEAYTLFKPVESSRFNFVLGQDIEVTFNAKDVELNAVQIIDLMKQANFVDYILNSVRSVAEFQSTNEVMFLNGTMADVEGILSR